MPNVETPRTTDQGQRTKRKYTVSDKVRAANRLKLPKALSVDKKIRYRLTPKRLAANRASLRKALQARRYKRYARDWVRAVDMRKTAVQAGETQEEYDRHMELMEQVLPAEGERQRNGVRGLGQALWRRRRLFGNRAQRELFSFYLELEEAAVEGLSLDSVQDLRCETCYVFLEGEHPRLEETMERLDQRLVRVTEAYLTELAEELVRLEVWGKHCYRADLLDQPPEVIGNGLVRRREVRRRMNKHHAKGKHTSLWLDAKGTKSHLLKAFVEAGHRLPDPRREEDLTLHLRLIEAAFFGGMDNGFGLKAGLGVRDLGLGKDTKSESRNPNPEAAASSLKYRVARVKRLFPELYQAVWNLAEATWERMQVYARQGEKEAEELRRKLERAARGTLGHGKKSLAQLWWEVRDRRLAQNPGDAIYQLLWAKFLVALKKAKAERRKAEARKRRAEARKQKQEAKKQEQEARSQEPEGPGLGTGDSGFGEQAEKQESEAKQGTGDRLQGTDAGLGTRDSGLGEQAEAAECKIQNSRLKIEEPRKQKSEAGSEQSEAAESKIGNPKSKIDKPRDPNPALDGLQWKVERLIGVFLCSCTYPAFQAAKECNRRVEEAFRGLEGAVEGALQRIDRLRAKREKGRIGKKRKAKREKGERGN